jgi:hypothetical protein
LNLSGNPRKIYAIESNGDTAALGAGPQGKVSHQSDARNKQSIYNENNQQIKGIIQSYNQAKRNPSNLKHFSDGTTTATTTSNSLIQIQPLNCITSGGPSNGPSGNGSHQL